MRILPFDFDRIDKDCVFLSNVAGEAVFLTAREFEVLTNEDFEWLSLERINELISKQFITEKKDIQLSVELLANKVRSRRSFLNYFTSLHMVVTTLRCNCMCSYCHASSKGGMVDSLFDMDITTAQKTVDAIFQSPSPVIKIEFQGGEPLLNFDVIKFVVEYAEVLNKKYCKDLSFVVCTNLLEISDEQLSFLYNHKVDISTSCDGSKELHDFCRKSLISDSAYDTFVDNLNRTRRLYTDNPPSALLTVTRKNLNNLRGVVNQYIEMGFNNIFIRALNPYGYAIDNEDALNYSIEDFIEAYSDVLSYIIDLNIKGTYFVESYASLLLQRILTPFSTGFVDLQSPSGAGISGCIYYYNGDVYPADEGRMLAERGDKSFCMGNVNKDSYNEIFDGEILHEIVRNSIVESMPGCAQCAYKAYCGADPIRYYVESGDIVGKRYNSNFCKKNKELIKELFKYIKQNDRDTMRVFWSWINRKPLEKHYDN